MTGELDGDLLPVALELIAEFGKAVTLIRFTDGAYDPATASSTHAATPEAINALVEDYKGYDFANGLAIAGDKKLTVAASGLTAPMPGMKITVDAVTYSVIQVMTIYSGELACLYVIQARK